ncbi:MAG: DUF72 domain-containing protein [Candidatus Acidiferrales bacterium]
MPTPTPFAADAPPALHLGTSAFTAAGWDTSFYPAGMKPADYLTYYASQFDSVEVDSTFYRTPSAATVNGWERKTPAHFVFSVKVPQLITHEKVLAGCDDDFKYFVSTMELLGPKLGPMVLQFPYFNRSVFPSAAPFLARLQPFLHQLPPTHQFALEIRNKNWLDAAFADLLRRHLVALVLQDQSWMPLPDSFAFDPITAPFTYIRWLGDRQGIEKITKSWDKVVVDRSAQLTSWVDFCQRILRRGVTVFAYANNHYAGHAPATIAQFLELWNKSKPSSERGEVGAENPQRGFEPPTAKQEPKPSRKSASRPIQPPAPAKTKPALRRDPHKKTLFD